jgi:3-oxoacyl-[acyl-carrier-protein] synthase III
MIGIEAIGLYIPRTRISNLDRASKFSTDKDFIKNKIGIEYVSRKGINENTSTLAIKALRNLLDKHSFDIESIEVLILVTQTPDSNIPHTSAVIHGEIGFSESCAAFDLSLGCSGFVYGLSVIKSFMEVNGLKKGILITSDPYSKILNPEDKNTSLLFGDAATATLLSDSPNYLIGNGTFGTIGKERDNLKLENNYLTMNGRGIFNFAARYIPKDVDELLTKNNLDKNDIDYFVFHQGSKYIIDTLIKRLNLDHEKTINNIREYGNTVSSSIPIILNGIIKESEAKKILISGFGVGLSWASNVLTRVNK